MSGRLQRVESEEEASIRCVKDVTLASPGTDRELLTGGSQVGKITAIVEGAAAGRRGSNVRIALRRLSLFWRGGGVNGFNGEHSRLTRQAVVVEDGRAARTTCSRQSKLT